MAVPNQRRSVAAAAGGPFGGLLHGRVEPSLPTPLETGRRGNMVRGPVGRGQGPAQAGCLCHTPSPPGRAWKVPQASLPVIQKNEPEGPPPGTDPTFLRAGDLDARTSGGGSRQPRAEPRNPCRFPPGPQPILEQGWYPRPGWKRRDKTFTDCFATKLRAGAKVGRRQSAPSSFSLL